MSMTDLPKMHPIPDSAPPPLLAPPPRKELADSRPVLIAWLTGTLAGAAIATAIAYSVVSGILDERLAPLEMKLSTIPQDLEKQVRTRSILLVDTAGKPRGVWFVSDTGQVSLNLLDAQGETMASLRAADSIYASLAIGRTKDGAQATLFVGDDGADLMLQDKSTANGMMFRAHGAQTGLIERSGEAFAGVSIMDGQPTIGLTNNTLSAELALNGNSGGLSLYDTTGKAKLRLGTKEDDVSLLLGKQPGKPGVIVSDSEEFGTSIAMYDDKGITRAVLGEVSLTSEKSDREEKLPASSLVLFSKDGHVEWKAPTN